jgi:threonine/homoserine/homoserine lactone efflux protein
MDITTWLAFVAASTLLLLLPGPTVLLVLSYALTQGRRVALATVAGVALGDAVAMTASLLGLGALVMASAELFTALKWTGAAYMVYLGVQLLRSAGGARFEASNNAPAVRANSVFVHAAAVTALNPKSIAFFIAFAPQFLDTSASLAPQFAIMIATFLGLAAINALAYALLADKLRRKLQRPSVIQWLTRIGGGALITMGAATAAASR